MLHRFVTAFAISAMVLLLVLSSACRPHDDYYTTEHGYKVTDIDGGLDVWSVLAELDAVVEYWVATQGGAEGKIKAQQIKYHVVNGWKFTTSSGWATGSFDARREHIDVAWYSYEVGPPYLPALYFELGRLVGLHDGVP